MVYNRSTGSSRIRYSYKFIYMKTYYRYMWPFSIDVKWGDIVDIDVTMRDCNHSTYACSRERLQHIAWSPWSSLTSNDHQCLWVFPSMKKGEIIRHCVFIDSKGDMWKTIARPSLMIKREASHFVKRCDSLTFHKISPHEDMGAWSYLNFLLSYYV